MTIVQRRPKDITLEMSDNATLAVGKVAKAGLYLPSQPEYERPRLRDADLTSLSDEDLTDLLVEYTEWNNYAAAQLALAEIDEATYEELLATAEAVAMVRDWGGTSKDRVTIAKAERQADPEVQARKQKLAEVYALRKLTKVVVESIERDLFAVSREITRRTGGDPRMRRGERHSK